jgi:hypothetical protein
MSDAVGKIGEVIGVKGPYVKLDFGPDTDIISGYYYPYSACNLTMEAV